MQSGKIGMELSQLRELHLLFFKEVLHLKNVILRVLTALYQKLEVGNS